MELIPQENRYFEIQKQNKVQDDIRPGEVLQRESSAVTVIKDGGFSQRVLALHLNGRGNIFFSTTIFNKFIEFVESQIFDFAIFKESIKQAAQHATTSIWSILKKTLEEYDQTNDREIIYLLGILMKISSDFTYEHSMRVMNWSVSLAQELELSDEQINTVKKGAYFKDIGQTGIYFSECSEEKKTQISEFLQKKIKEFRECGELHDIGKLQIPKEILHKTSMLTDEEYEIMKQHPIIGEAMLKPIKSLQKILPAVRNHHERWDGRGYPDELKGEESPLEARIVAIVDAFDAMISDRPYRKALKVENAIAELVKNSGTQFDPNIVGSFIKIIKQDAILSKPGNFLSGSQPFTNGRQISKNLKVSGNVCSKNLYSSGITNMSKNL